MGEKESMVKCMECENEVIRGSDYCDQCEQKMFKKIGGWLWLPALGLVASLISYVVSFLKTLKILFDGSSSLLPTNVVLSIWFELFSFAALFLLTIYVSSLFIRKKCALPRWYIALIIIPILYSVVDLIIAAHVLKMKIDYDDARTLVRSIVSACIWIPYFLISVRVKRTFIH